MLMRFLLLLFICFLNISCTQSTPVSYTIPLNELANRELPPFNRVVVVGNINISLHTGYSRPQVLLKGAPIDLSQVRTIVSNHTLYLEVGRGYPRVGPIQATIKTRYLNAFNFQGVGDIKGTRLRSGFLDVTIDNPSRTLLGGNINLHRLTVSGGGYTYIRGANSPYLKLSILDGSKVRLEGIYNLGEVDLAENAWLGVYWVKSNNLVIRSHGQGVIKLAGVVDLLDLELWGTSRFNGKYLRVRRSFVKTHDRAIAEIATLDKQHSLATDSSDIYFYYIPAMRTDFMAFDGSVLDMRDLHPPFVQEYDRYNK